MAAEMPASLKEAQEVLASWLAESRSAVVFTGAGISTESGIPDFRGPNGIWKTQDPAKFHFERYLDDPDMRRNSWRAYVSGGMGAQAEPNPAHEAVAKLVQYGIVRWVITQNVDGLHARSGVPEERLLELHGSSRFAKCIACWQRFTRDETITWPIEEPAGVPLCPRCGGLMKPGGVSFGEPMPERETAEAVRVSRLADLCLVVGSTLTVYPAASMPAYTVEQGGRLAILNIGETTLDRFADLRVEAKAAEFLPRVAELVLTARGLG